MGAPAGESNPAPSVPPGSHATGSLGLSGSSNLCGRLAPEKACLGGPCRVWGWGATGVAVIGCFSATPMCALSRATPRVTGEPGPAVNDARPPARAGWPRTAGSLERSVLSDPLGRLTPNHLSCGWRSNDEWAAAAVGAISLWWILSRPRAPYRVLPRARRANRVHLSASSPMV